MLDREEDSDASPMLIGAAAFVSISVIMFSFFMMMKTGGSNDHSFGKNRFCGSSFGSSDFIPCRVRAGKN
jgi:hypothetical protein